MDCIVCTDFTLLLLSIPTCMTAVCWRARLITTLTPHLFIIVYDASFCTFSLAGFQGQSDLPYAYRSLDRSGHLFIYIFPFSVYFNNQRTVYAQQRPLRSVRLHCDFSRSQLFFTRTTYLSCCSSRALTGTVYFRNRHISTDSPDPPSTQRLSASQTPAPAPQQPDESSQNRTRSGRIVRPPGNWWEVRPNRSDGDTSMPDAPTGPQPEDGDTDMSSSSEVALSTHTTFEPKTYRQAMASADASRWQQAMDEELASLKENEVWEVVPRPTHRKIVDSKWVYKIKTNENGEICWKYSGNSVSPVYI